MMIAYKKTTNIRKGWTILSVIIPHTPLPLIFLHSNTIMMSHLATARAICCLKCESKKVEMKVREN